MSANLIVDLGGAALLGASLPGGIVVSPSGLVDGLSGVLVGDTVDSRDANVFTNVVVMGRSVTSGPLRVGVQTSPDGLSGTFTDPTSGLAALPTRFASGGWLIIGQSGTAPGHWNPGEGVSGQYLKSGFCVAAGFQSPHRYMRAILGSGFYDGPLQVAFVKQQRTTGSGGGFTFSPGSGSINV